MEIINQDLIFTDSKLVTRSVIQLDDLVLRPNDILHLGQPCSKGLVLLVSVCQSQIKLGRIFDGALISAIDSIPLSPLRWRVLHSIVAIERQFGTGVLSGGHWNIAIKGAPVAVQEHLSKDATDTKMSAIYLSELCALLKEYTPHASIVVAEDYQTATALLDKCSQGCVWFIPKTTEKISVKMLATKAWQIPSRRSRRMKWNERKAKASEQKYFSPLPKVHLTAKEDKLASK